MDAKEQPNHFLTESFTLCTSLFWQSQFEDRQVALFKLTQQASVTDYQLRYCQIKLVFYLPMHF